MFAATRCRLSPAAMKHITNILTQPQYTTTANSIAAKFPMATPTKSASFPMRRFLSSKNCTNTPAQKKTLVLLGTGWGTATILKSIDTRKYNITVISPRNYFLFTPLLPSCTVGTTESRSIMEPIHTIVGRKRSSDIKFYEAECTSIDTQNKILSVQRTSTDGTASSGNKTISYDYLVVGVGGTPNTFGTPGVKEYACFLKEMGDANKIRHRLHDTLARASFDDITEDERERLLHMVVVGGGPTGIEYAGELYDFLEEDVRLQHPELANKVKITLVEASENVLPTFNRRIIAYTKSIFKKNSIEIRTNTMVKEVREKSFVVQNPDGKREEIPYGTIVWAAGVSARPFAHKLRAQFPDIQKNPRGIIIDNHLRVKGATDIWALGDCTVSDNAPLAQVASQQGKWLSRALNTISDSDGSAFEKMEKEIAPFKYSSNGSLAYIGGEKAVAEIPFFRFHVTAGGLLTSIFWKSYCLWELFSMRSSWLVATDWAKCIFYGRDLSAE